MKPSARATALLIAMTFAPLTTGPAFAAPAEKQEPPSCTLTTDAPKSAEMVDCTATGGIPTAEKMDKKSSAYPDGPVTMGSGIVF